MPNSKGNLALRWDFHHGSQWFYHSLSPCMVLGLCIKATGLCALLNWGLKMEKLNATLDIQNGADCSQVTQAKRGHCILGDRAFCRTLLCTKDEGGHGVHCSAQWAALSCLHPILEFLLRQCSHYRKLIFRGLKLSQSKKNPIPLFKLT